MTNVDPAKCPIQQFVCNHCKILYTDLIALLECLVLLGLGLGVPVASLKETGMVGYETPQAEK